MRYKIELFVTITLVSFIISGCNQHPGNVDKTNEDTLQDVVHEATTDKPMPIPPDTKVGDISEFKKTAFVPTLENQIDNGKNSIYTPSFLFAWKKLKSTINRPIKVDETKEPSLAIINNSKTFEGSIAESELHDSVFVMDDGIKVSSSFSKNLPYAICLDNLENPLMFSNQKVSSYGIKNHYEKLAAEVEILYYKSDQCFMIRLITRDTDEVILAKGMPDGNSLGNYVQTIARLREMGKKESITVRNRWKYSFNRVDELAIPVIKFNIRDEYKELIGGNKFSTVDRQWRIHEAVQKTSFLLNKNGASVSSVAIVASDSAAPDQPRFSPKKLVFDSPFIVVLKHKNVANPYFVARIANVELMQKEQ